MQKPVDIIRSQIVGESLALHEALNQLERIASFPKLNALIYGETGTGKELAAKLFHFKCRPSGPFVAINCSEFSKELLESEIFGHEKGAFSGAVRDRVGLIELAHEGTLFLDEIGDMPLHLQAKLLRVIQEKEVRRVGSNTVCKIDVRIVAATHRDLKAMVETGEFRKDFLYRLGTNFVTLPPLRDRVGDVLLLAKHFLVEICSGLSLSCKAESLLLRYSWPGNIRELQKVMEAAVVNSHGRQIEPRHIEPYLEDVAGSEHASEDKETRCKRILAFIREVGTAKSVEIRAHLDIHRSTLHRELQKLEHGGRISRIGQGHASRYVLATSLNVDEQTSKVNREEIVGTRPALSRHQVQVLSYATEARSVIELMGVLDWRDRTKFRNKYVRPLLETGWLKMTIPDKPSSSKQQYIVTSEGLEVLREIIDKETSEKKGHEATKLFQSDDIPKGRLRNNLAHSG